MKKLSIAFLLTLAALPVAAQQPQQFPTKDQYKDNEILAKMTAIGQLLDEIAKVKADLAKSEAELAKLKAPAETPKPTPAPGK